MKNDLKAIKRHYGEKMMQLCRTLFPEILDVPGLLYSTLKEHFGFSRSLAYDIIKHKEVDSFKSYIRTLCGLNDVSYDKTDEPVLPPYELMRKAGYTLYECNSEADIQAFRRYYRAKEALCTFNGGRLKSCYVFFAVKDGAEKLRREDFKNPEREDEYGTSVISIQFGRGETNYLSIKNRYNHRVANPDFTFQNNLENIIPGLTLSFIKKYNFKIVKELSRFYLSGYINIGKYYKYNNEINNIYYCENNVIIDNNQIIDTYKDKEKYILVDYFIIDLVNKKVFLYDETIQDSFINGLDNLVKIDIRKDKKENLKVITLYKEDGTVAILKINNSNQLIVYEDKKLEIIGDRFLVKNKTLEKLDVPNVKKIGISFMFYNNVLTELNLPEVTEIGNVFLDSNDKIKIMYLPNVKKIGNGFFEKSKNCLVVNMPNVEIIGGYFMRFNKKLRDLNMPNVQSVGEKFLFDADEIEAIDLPSLKQAGEFVLCKCSNLKMLNVPELTTVGKGFLSHCPSFEVLYAPKLKELHDQDLKDCPNTKFKTEIDQKRNMELKRRKSEY